MAIAEGGDVTDCFTLESGHTPLLISIPHDGRVLAPGMAERMTADGLQLPDTDWHVRQLYRFASTLGAGTIAANYSRYVVDLNRASTDEVLYVGQLATGLCPTKTFFGEDIYKQGEGCDAQEQRQRVNVYWQPYHTAIEAELRKISERFGYALLWDAHSIRSEVPLLFDGTLPELNIGTNSGTSCDSRLADAVVSQAEASSYSTAVNARFKGGFITRHVGAPDNNIHAIQLELVQHCYMEENTRRYDVDAAERLVVTLELMLKEFMASAERHLH